MQSLHAFRYTKGFGNFSQEMNNTLQSALSGSTETYTIQLKKIHHFQHHFAEKKSKFGAKRKWNALIQLKTLLFYFLLVSSTSFLPVCLAKWQAPYVFFVVMLFIHQFIYSFSFEHFLWGLFYDPLMIVSWLFSKLV